jgi:hypothetical protein
MFEIQKNVPRPVTIRKGFTRASKYPFATMEVGDMFFVPGSKKSFSSLVSAAGRRIGVKFSTRRLTDDEGTAGTGCWRVE